MREESKSEILHDALQYLDDEMIEEVDSIRGSVLHEKKKVPRKWVALAASICLFFVVGGAWSALHQDETRYNESANDIEAEIQENRPGNEDVNDDVNESFEENLGVQEGAPENESNFADWMKPEAYEDMELGNTESGLEDYIAIQYHLKGMESEGKKVVSEEKHAVIDKFIESYRNAYKNETVRLVEEASLEEVEKEADAHLYIQLSNGTMVHFVLFGNEMVCFYEIPSVWIEIDKRVYDAVLDVLRDE